MEVFLIRHAEAEPRRPGRDDAARPLTPRGRKRMVRATQGLKRLGLGFDRLYHSPWLRAVETGNVLAPLVRGESVVTARLAESPGLALLDELSGARVALVGHQPWLGELLALLTSSDPKLGPHFAFGKGGLAWLEGEPRPGEMTLRALWPSKALRAVAR